MSSSSPYISGLNYGTYTTALSGLTIISSNDTNFQNILPSTINYAEQRIYREIDFLFNYQADFTQVSSNQNILYYPQNFGVYLVVNQIAVLTPASTATTGQYNQLQVTSIPFIQTVYPSAATSIGLPKYFYPIDDVSAYIAPATDQAYTFWVYGTQRPPVLSASNSSTFLTQNYPDILVAASMIYLTGYMKNWSAQGDDPRSAVSWESQYQLLVKEVKEEESRKKFNSEAWQATETAPLATPKRV
jgi:hypothetical protein